jgi:hypothetical protein
MLPGLFPLQEMRIFRAVALCASADLKRATLFKPLITLGSTDGLLVH